MYSRLCLLGDLERQSTFDSSLTVSRYETTGSDFCKKSLEVALLLRWLSREVSLAALPREAEGAQQQAGREKSTLLLLKAAKEGRRSLWGPPREGDPDLAL